MMSLPQVFYKSGVIPTVFCIILVCVCSSLAGTFFAEAIAGIPNNCNYGLCIEYSTVFEILVGRNCYLFAEIFFIVACLVQCCTGVVQAAQSLDSFVASFVLGETYGLQLYPSIEFITWSEASCETVSKSGGSLYSCIPFNDSGSLIITLGFVLVTLIFLPLGLQNLKETVIVQIVSFFCLLMILFQFNGTFVDTGLTFSVPLIGNNYSELAGVVLFNFAFIITLPAWLIEKKTSVNPNTVIWSTSIYCSFLYITFGLFAAAAYGPGSGKMIALLASSEVTPFTRFCAAFFGVSIIGAG